MINYHDRKFKPISNTENGEVDGETLFHYKQEGNVITCHYNGNFIQIGHLIGLVDEQGNIKICYHQVNTKGELMTGICLSTAEIMTNGKIRLHEDWQWTSGSPAKRSG